jgi:uncharacterized coiled-coil protein SlyX
MPLDTPIEPPNRGGYDALASRVALVEGDVRDIKETLTDMRVMIARMDAHMSHLATKAEIAELRTDMQTGLAELRTEMHAGFAETPSKTYMWGILGVLLTAYACGLAALAIVK